MSAKKKKQSNSPLRVIIILVLLGLLAYKHQLFDGKLLENIPTIESNEEKPEILTSPPTWRCIGNSDDTIKYRRPDSET